MREKNFIKLIILHVLLGIAVYILPVLSKVYLLAIFIYFFNKIYKTKQSERGVQVLMACGYVIGAEVFMRMTHGTILYEISKYYVILFCIFGLISMGLNKKSMPYIIYMLLLVPGILIAGFNIGTNTTIRTALTFNLSGPICLGIVALFCYQLKIRYLDFHKILYATALPLITTITYLFLYNPDIRDVLTGTYSNYATSGGFGPNQVATVLGFGMFIFVTRFFTLSKTLILKIINLGLLALMAYRGVVTFSRGGIITALIIIAVFIYSYFKKSNAKNKYRTVGLFFGIFGIVLITWVFTSLQTDGFIDKRYANQDAAGREKEDLSTGRSNLTSFEIDEFLKNPIFGVGVGKIKELRHEAEGIEAASHNEVSRILSEHGSLGAIAFLILLLTPLVLRHGNRSNIFFFSCYLFWLLTINHSSMRIAAPSFIYGLCLLDIIYEKPPIHRKRIIKKR